MLFERQFDMRFGGFGRRFRGRLRGGFEAEFDLLLVAEQVAPVAVFIPFGAVGFDGVLDALAAVATLQVFGAAVFVAAPADAFGVFGENGKFFGHDVCRLLIWFKAWRRGWKRDACSCRIAWSATGINIPFSLALHFAHLRNGI